MQKSALVGTATARLAADVFSHSAQWPKGATVRAMRMRVTMPDDQQYYLSMLY